MSAEEKRVRFDVGSQYAGKVGVVVKSVRRRSGPRSVGPHPFDYMLRFSDGFIGWFLDEEVEPLTTAEQESR